MSVRLPYVRALALIALIALVSCSRSGPDKGARTRPPPLVSVAKVQARDVPVEVHAPVDLRPLALADVGAKTLGYLDAVLVDRGDKVKKGQLLALVRPSDLPDQLAAARGVLAQNQSSVALARSNLDRSQQLAPSGVVSQQVLQQSVAALAASEASEAAAKAQLAALAVRLGETRIVSPLDGVVSSRRLDPGALVGPTSANSVIMTVARIDVLRVFIAVNEHEAGGVAVGKMARVEVDALPGRLFWGKVVRLSPAFDPTTRTIEAEIHLPNENGEMRAGMYGRGSILLETHPGATVLWVNSVQISDKQRYVFVLHGDKVQRRTVDVGVDGGNWLEIKAGVRPGEEVVVAGVEGLAEGSTVRVARDIDPYSGAKIAGDAPSGKRQDPEKATN